MRSLALAAALASAALATPASAAAEPVQGYCTYVSSATGVGGSGFTFTVVAAAATTTPAAATGVACWIEGLGSPSDAAVFPGNAVAMTRQRSAYWLPGRLCEQHWAYFLDGTSYTSPVRCS